jgi:hypothetical protein
MRRVVLITLFVAAIGSFALASHAGAQSYGGCQATASSTSVAPGDTITVSGTGAAPEGTVVASIGDSDVG